MKKPRAGGEIDAYCTKCRLDLNHRIVAMVGDQVKQVECLTCRGTHTYRRPKSEIAHEAEKRAAARAYRDAGAGSRAARTPGVPRETNAARAEREQRVTWEKSIAGQPASAFRAYRIFETFNPGDLVRHSKFGDGVIARVIDRGKVEALFQEGPTTLAQNQNGS
jgi:hypothetical protein